MLRLGLLLVGLCISNAVAQTVDFDIATSGATRTAYWNQSVYAATVDSTEASKYTLVHLEHVIRHGAAYPTTAFSQQVLTLVTQLNTNYGTVIPSWLRGYYVPYDASVDGLISSAGGVELSSLATRLRQNVGTSTAFPATFSSDQFVVQYSTNSSRVKYGALNFATGLFYNWSDVKYTERSDLLLRFYDQCPRFTRDVLQNAASYDQANAYKKSTAMTKSIEILRSKLKLPTSATLTAADVQTVYTACAYDLSLYKRKNNWCTLVTKDLAKAAEYVEDLEWFYTRSGGNKLNFEMSAGLLKDVFQGLKDFSSGSSKLAANFRLVDAEATLPLITLIGLVDKTPLLADATVAAIDARGFRTSRFAVFAANVEFRLLTSKADASFYVQLRVNEQTVKFPGCNDQIFCKLSDVEKLWGYYLMQYDAVAACKV